MTVTTEDLRAVEAVLATRREDLTARLTSDRTERQGFRDKITRVATDLANSHSIGEQFDDMMEALGLPRRPETQTVSFLIHFTESIEEYPYDVRLSTDVPAFINRTGMSNLMMPAITWTVEMTMAAPVPDEHYGCACGTIDAEQAERLVRESEHVNMPPIVGEYDPNRSGGRVDYTVEVLRCGSYECTHTADVSLRRARAAEERDERRTRRAAVENANS